MFSRTFKFKGYDGKDHEETWWFNLSEEELYKLELIDFGGMQGLLKKLVREDKPAKIIEVFERVILGSVGERSVDGRKFMKKKHSPSDMWGDVAEDFRETPAYSELFMELVSTPDKMIDFLKGAIPAEIAAKLAAEEVKNNNEDKETGKVLELPKPEDTNSGGSD